MPPFLGHSNLDINPGVISLASDDYALATASLCFVKGSGNPNFTGGILGRVASAVIGVSVIGGGAYILTSSDQPSTPPPQTRTEEYNPPPSSTPNIQATPALERTNGLDTALTFESRPEMRSSSPDAPTLLFYRNTHANRYTSGQTHLSEKVGVAIYQLILARDFQEKNLSRMFMEGLTETLEPSWFADANHHFMLHTRISRNYTLNDIRAAFPNGLPSDNLLTERQVNILYACGGEFVYATLRGNVTLLRTISPETDRQVLQRENVLIASVAIRLGYHIGTNDEGGIEVQVPQERLDRGGIDWRAEFTTQERTEYDDFAHRLRNEAFMRELRAEHAARPGETHYVVFGARHDFCGAIRNAGISANITSIWLSPMVNSATFPQTCL